MRTCDIKVKVRACVLFYTAVPPQSPSYWVVGTVGTLLLGVGYCHT
jgi:hypothetical protein